MLSILAFCHFLLLFLIILIFFLFSFKNVLVLSSLLCIHRDCNCMLLLLKKFNKEKLIRVVLLWSSNNVKLLLHMASGIFITMCLCLVSDGIFGFHQYCHDCHLFFTIELNQIVEALQFKAFRL